MKKGFKTALKVLGIIVAIPILLIIFVIGFEVFGYYSNHAATDKQTKELKEMIIRDITDAEITDEYSETGNTTGTGNHVDCLSRISFRSGEEEETVSGIFSQNYDDFELEYADGVYTITLNTSAPFPDNIEGH